MCVCRQDPCAGGHRWIEVTGATVSCRCCSYGTHGALQTLVLRIGRRERVQRHRRDGKMEELSREKRAVKNNVRGEGDKKGEKGKYEFQNLYFLQVIRL